MAADEKTNKKFRRTQGLAVGPANSNTSNNWAVGSDGSMTVESTSASVTIKSTGSGKVVFGTAGGNTGFIVVDPDAFTAPASTDVARLRIENANAITVPAGTATVGTNVFVAEPNLTATGTVTHATSLYVEAAPTEGGTSNSAVMVAAGNVILAGSGAALATSATTGFTAISGSAGAPTATPSGFTTGAFPIHYDSTNNRFYVRNTVTSAWLASAVFT